MTDFNFYVSKDNVLGLTLKGSDAKNLLSRAASRYVHKDRKIDLVNGHKFRQLANFCRQSWSSSYCSSPFFVQPIFREDGYFLLLSQYQEPGECSDDWKFLFVMHGEKAKKV